MLRNPHIQKRNKQGFSLIEIIVSLAIFGIVSTIALGAYLKVMDANAKAQSLKTAVNNLNFALEAVSREIRVGSHVQCGVLTAYPDLSLSGSSGRLAPLGCIGGAQGIAFHSARQRLCGGRYKNLVSAYKFENNALYKAEQDQCASSQPIWSPMTSTDLKLTNPNFFVTLEGSVGNPEVARVLMVVGGEAGGKEKVKTVFNVQTTVAQRLGN